MACMGPDLNLARAHGNKIALQLLEELCKHSLTDWPEAWKQGMIQLPDAKQRWEDARARFIKAVEDLYVEDEANGF